MMKERIEIDNIHLVWVYPSNIINIYTEYDNVLCTIEGKFKINFIYLPEIWRLGACLPPDNYLIVNISHIKIPHAAGHTSIQALIKSASVLCFRLHMTDETSGVVIGSIVWGSRGH